jgi:hypothetical protein
MGIKGMDIDTPSKEGVTPAKKQIPPNAPEPPMKSAGPTGNTPKHRADARRDLGKWRKGV